MSLDKAIIVTEGDIKIEEFIIREIYKQFPEDLIIAEETNSHTILKSTGRYWLIDPICGTSNYNRGGNLFATNIALAENGKLIAGCVIDHCEGNYIWSIGENQIFINQEDMGNIDLTSTQTLYLNLILAILFDLDLRNIQKEPTHSKALLSF